MYSKQIKEEEVTEFKDKVAVITGGAHGIGKTITEEFEKADDLPWGP